MLVAASNIEEPGTSFCVSTLHNAFGFDGDYESKLDFSKTTDQKVAEIIGMQLLLIDEVSMLDICICACVFRSVHNVCFVRPTHPTHTSIFWLTCRYNQADNDTKSESNLT